MDWHGLSRRVIRVIYEHASATPAPHRRFKSPPTKSKKAPCKSCAFPLFVLLPLQGYHGGRCWNGPVSKMAITASVIMDSKNTIAKIITAQRRNPLAGKKLGRPSLSYVYLPRSIATMDNITMRSKPIMACMASIFYSLTCSSSSSLKSIGSSTPSIFTYHKVFPGGGLSGYRGVGYASISLPARSMIVPILPIYSGFSWCLILTRLFTLSLPIL